MPETFLCWNADDDPGREAVPWAVRTKDARTAAEEYAECRWCGDEEETRRVQVQQAGEERRENFLVHVHMVPHFRATREEHF